ncbi:(deoxy)nucleoside triphosphate pyrophosphohydrolase [Nocardioidaceae bacterium]|nr:(deoxy)nucleoside triphosphate pyrophosphohydrolase [Nocardioidaceae bacterium]
MKGTPRLVVGAAIVHGDGDDRQVLAAQRTDPPEVAGRWEFPGGKVEPDESPEDAVVRELAEELDVQAEVLEWLDGEVPVKAGLVLRVALVRLVSGVPAPHEHSAVQWVAAGQLREVDWLDSDLPFVDQLATRWSRSEAPAEPRDPA